MNRAMELRANSYRVTLLARPVTRKYLGNGSWRRPVAIPKKITLPCHASVQLPPLLSLGSVKCRKNRLFDRNTCQSRKLRAEGRLVDI